MKFDNIYSIYFIGIGGIGMSVLVWYFNLCGVQVVGYDCMEMMLIKILVVEGIEVCYVVLVVILFMDVDLVVYMLVIFVSYEELSWFCEQNYLVYKCSQVLGVISEGMCIVVVVGIYGKIIIFMLIIYLLYVCGIDCNVFLGGVVCNFELNFVVGSMDWVVVEVDEFDCLFLMFYLDVVMIMLMDVDYLDIYGDEESLL